MDKIGPFPFIRLSDPPQRAQTQWEVSATPGISGSTLWNLGARGEEFDVQSEAVAVSFAAGRAYIFDYLTLVDAGPIPVWFGTLEPQQYYKVTKVTLIQVKRVVRAVVANDPTNYGAIVLANWRLLPIDPTIGIPT